MFDFFVFLSLSLIALTFLLDPMGESLIGVTALILVCWASYIAGTWIPVFILLYSAWRESRRAY